MSIEAATRMEDLYQLAEQLITWDERMILWRFHHLKVVERIIGGNVIGTQGTPVEVLGKRIDVRFFPDLWTVRDEITRQSPLGATDTQRLAAGVGLCGLELRYAPRMLWTRLLASRPRDWQLACRHHPHAAFALAAARLATGAAARVMRACFATRWRRSSPLVRGPAAADWRGDLPAAFAVLIFPAFEIAGLHPRAGLHLRT